MPILRHETGDPFLRQFASQDLDAKVAQTLSKWLGSDLGEAKCDETTRTIEPIWIEPYRNNFLILYVFRYGALEGSLEDVNVTIDVTDGIEQIASITNGVSIFGKLIYQHALDGPNERYVFYLPPPGKYVIKVDKADPCRDISLQFGTRGITYKQLNPLIDPLTGSVRFLEVDQEPFYDVVNPQRFRFQFLQVSDSGQISPLKEIPKYPLNTNLRVQSANNATVQVDQVYPLKLVNAAEAVYEALEPIDLKIPAFYTWELSVTADNPRAKEPDPSLRDGTPIDVLKVQGEFEVLHKERNFTYRLNPELQNKITLNDKNSVEPLNLSVQVLDDAGNPFPNVVRLTPEGQSPFKAELAKKIIDVISTRLIDSQEMQSDEKNTYNVSLGGKEKTGESFDEGCYQIKVSLTNRHYNYLHPISKEPIVHEFCFEKTNFSYSITSPIDGSNFVYVDGALTQDFIVTVALTDPQGKIFSQDLDISQSKSQPFKATVSKENGSLVVTQKLAHKSGNLYTATMGRRSDFPPGCYRLAIEMTDDYRKDLFQLIENKLIEKTICVKQGQKFSWTLSNPLPDRIYPLRPPFNWFAPPIPENVMIISVMPEGSEMAIDASKMAVNSTDALFSGDLINTANGDITSVEFIPRGQSSQFVANWPFTATTSATGEYILQNIEIDSENLSPVWIPLPYSQEPVRFHLKDQPWTMPWSLLALLLLILIFVSLIALVILNAGGLYECEVILISDPRAKSYAGGATKIWNFLRTWKYTVSKGQVDRDLIGADDIETIEAKVVACADKNARIAADLIIVYTDGAPAEVPQLHDTDPPAPIGRQRSIKIEKKGNARFIHQAIPGFLIFMTLLIIWFAVFASLYFMNT